jgi:hypothetical protein
MVQKSVAMVAAWLEIVAGAALLTVPDVSCLLVFGVKPEDLGTVLARFAGIALVALGTACLHSTTAGSPRSAILGLLVFNVGVAILLAWVGVVTTLHGFLLWPAVILHTVIAVALLPQLRTTKLKA